MIMRFYLFYLFISNVLVVVLIWMYKHNFSISFYIYSRPAVWSQQPLQVNTPQDVNCNVYCIIQWHPAAHCQVSEGQNVPYTMWTPMKFIQASTLVMRKLEGHKKPSTLLFNSTLLNSWRLIKMLKCFPSFWLVCFLLHLFRAAAKNKTYLRMMGITHVLNAAEGCRYGQVDTGHIYYRDMPSVKYDKHSFSSTFIHLHSIPFHVHLFIYDIINYILQCAIIPCTRGLVKVYKIYIRETFFRQLMKSTNCP